MVQSHRTERDSMGEMQVPHDAYYGAQTARAVQNFPISSLRFPRSFIRALGLIKKHAAITNGELGLLPKEIANAISNASQEVMDGRWNDQFVVDVFQTGSGTSTNMNANEVVANRASEILTGNRSNRLVHPNDHVNRGQSSNDVIPTALHIAALSQIEGNLVPAISELRTALQAKAEQFSNIIKIGRTHFQDATPVTLGQEFGGYAKQLDHGLARLRHCDRFLGELPLGGTAVGTGLNTHPEFAPKTICGIAKETGLPFREAENHFEAQGARDACVETSGALKTIAASLIKIAGDIRFLSSGPRLGIGELKLPPTQPGSSIMPGKINPVICEMMIQVAVQVIGNDVVITYAGAMGNLELNVMMPLMTYNLLQSIDILASASRAFANRCVAGIEADASKCEGNVERSLAMCTALAPVIGYDKAAEIAKEAFKTGRTIREIAVDKSGLPPARVAEILDPRLQLKPSA